MAFSTKLINVFGSSEWNLLSLFRFTIFFFVLVGFYFLAPCSLSLYNFIYHLDSVMVAFCHI